MADFHRGSRAALTLMYETHFQTVKSAVSPVLSGADRETVIHEVFFRLISDENLRRSYHSGAFGKWLFVVAKNHAIDYARRRARETPLGLVPGESSVAVELEPQIDARALLRRFREQVLPAEWLSVFEARFVKQLDQRAAARAAGVPRTTLVYRELRIRKLLRAFLLGWEANREQP